jgi:hypothetical protein
MYKTKRKPCIENKYNLKFDDIANLILLKPECLNEEYFWYNKVVKAWCLSGTVVASKKDPNGSMDDDFWLGIYDKDAPEHAGETLFHCTSYGGMCGYTFENFYGEDDMENDIDFRLHELILQKINKLIDLGILGVKK